MNELYVENFADLMNGKLVAEIVCPVHNRVVRRLYVNGDRIQIDFLLPPIVSTPMDTPILYEPWCMDRGNLWFPCIEAPDGRAKVCTEGDIIRYEDGTQYGILPLHAKVS